MRNRFFVILFFWLMACSLVHANQTLVINAGGEFPLNAPDQSGFLDKVAAEAFHRSDQMLKTIHFLF